MTAEHQIELYRQRSALHDKITYFLLAAVGACIGFALTQTKDLPLSWNQVPLGIALVMWAASFLAGCRRIAATESILASNMALVQVRVGEDPGSGRDGRLIEIASRQLLAEIDQINKKLMSAVRVQHFCLFLGVICYVIWHVMEMASRQQCALSI